MISEIIRFRRFFAEFIDQHIYHTFRELDSLNLGINNIIELITFSIMSNLNN